LRTEDRLSSLPETSKHAGTQIGDGAGIAMFMPHPSSLRANAVWITAANWAEGAARRWGQSWTMIPGELLSPAQVRALANRPAVAPRDSAVRRWIPTVARTALKDMRLLAHRRNVSRTYPTGGLDTQQIAFVWQHHDLFLRTGTTFARRHGLPLVQFVDAPVVWESRRWGVRRPGGKFRNFEQPTSLRACQRRLPRPLSPTEWPSIVWSSHPAPQTGRDSTLASHVISSEGDGGSRTNNSWSGGREASDHSTT